MNYIKGIEKKDSKIKVVITRIAEMLCIFGILALMAMAAITIIIEN